MWFTFGSLRGWDQDLRSKDNKHANQFDVIIRENAAACTKHWEILVTSLNKQSFVAMNVYTLTGTKCRPQHLSFSSVTIFLFHKIFSAVRRSEMNVSVYYYRPEALVQNTFTLLVEDSLHVSFFFCTTQLASLSNTIAMGKTRSAEAFSHTRGGIMILLAIYLLVFIQRNLLLSLYYHYIT
jgi:hypothetical protein